MSDSDRRLDKFLPFQLAIASGVMSDIVFAACDDRFRLTIPEWRLIASLGDASQLAQIDLVRSTSLDKVAVNRACKALMNRGYLIRSPHSSDRRSHLLELSDTGKMLFINIWSQADKIADQMFACFTSHEIQKMQKILGKLLQSTVELQNVSGTRHRRRSPDQTSAISPNENQSATIDGTRSYVTQLTEC